MLTLKKFVDILPVKIFLFLIVYSQSAGSQLYEGSRCNTNYGKPGVCIKLTECESVFNALKSGEMSFNELSRCSFIGKTEVICCEDHASIALVTKIEISTSIPNEIIFEDSARRPEGGDGFVTGIVDKIPTTEKYENNQDSSNWWKGVIGLISTTQRNNFPTLNDFNSQQTNSMSNGSKTSNFGSNGRIHTDPTTRIGGKANSACEEFIKEGNPTLDYHILGGLPTAVGMFPHMAALGYRGIGEGEGIDWRCGGSLISNQFILTAAHCVADQNSEIAIIRLGKVSLNSSLDDAFPVDVTVKRVIPHPSYKTSKSYHDIALIQINEVLRFNSSVRPACLYGKTDDIDPNQELIVTGWGAVTPTNRQKSSELLQVNLTSADLTFCNRSLMNYFGSVRNRRFSSGLMEGQMCAYDPSLKGDTCQGDSGGPLQILDKRGISTIVGVTSVGPPCGSEVPGIYSKVSYYLEWIEDNVW